MHQSAAHRDNPELEAAISSGGRFRLRWLAIAIIAAVQLLWSLAAHAEPTFPPLTGRVVDEVRILSQSDLAELQSTLRELEGKSSDQIVIYVTKSLQGYEIEDFGYRLGRFWKIGQAPINNGIVLIVAPNERKVRIEVGRGLEPQMTDLMSKLIIENAILPGFRRGDFPAGIKAGVRDIKDVLLGDAEAVKERARYVKKRDQSNDGQIPLLVFIVILVLFYLVFVRNAQRLQRYPGNVVRNRRLGDGRVIVVPGGWGGSGGWSGGSGGWSGGSSGGGFSGGGGSFGGGGASGSW